MICESRFWRLDYYITFVWVCQGVFEKFFKNFRSLPTHSREVPDYYITLSRFCQEVFGKFFQTFSWFFVRVSLSQNSRIIISHPLAFVKRFSKSFLNFFVIFRGFQLISLKAFLVDSSHIIALLFPFVKGVFQYFSALEGLAVCHNFVVTVLGNMHKYMSIHASACKKEGIERETSLTGIRKYLPSAFLSPTLIPLIYVCPQGRFVNRPYKTSFEATPQPRSFVPRAVMMFSLRSKWCCVCHANDVVPVGTNEKIQLIRVGFFVYRLRKRYSCVLH